jgi:hypothetical protein
MCPNFQHESSYFQYAMNFCKNKVGFTFKENNNSIFSFVMTGKKPNVFFRIKMFT